LLEEYKTFLESILERNCGPCLTGTAAPQINIFGFRSSAENTINNMIRTKIFKLVSIFFITSFLFAGFFIASPLLAAEDYGLNESAGEVSAYQNQINNYNNNFLTSKIGSIIGLVLSFIGVIFLILMIFAGLSWMTANGSQEKVNKAKDLMINAIIGLVIVLAAYAITAFVGNNLL